MLVYESPVDADQPTAFYAALATAAVRARLRELPAGASALESEIDALRALLKRVAEDPALDEVQRLEAFCKGSDSLGRLYRLRHTLEKDGASSDTATLDAVLKEL